MFKQVFPAIIAGSMIALGASAQSPDINSVISAYNDAVTSGSPQDRVEAASALGQAALSDPDRDDSVLLAYEAAQTLCVYAGCEGARDIARFAEDAATGQMVAPEDAAMVRAFADWKDKDNRSNRKALDEALSDMVDLPVSMLSIMAFYSRYIADYKGGDWRDAEASAGQAIAHFAQSKNQIGMHWSNAKIASIVSSFNGGPDTEDVLDMARHHVALGTMAAAKPDEYEAWLNEHLHLTKAWTTTMSAYYHSGGGRSATSSRLKGPNPDRLDDKINAIMAELPEDSYRSDPSRADTSADDASELPFCDGFFDMDPELEFPYRAARKGMYGTVIARISVTDLKVSDVEILAAVPSSTFEEPAAEKVRQWTWDVKSGIPGDTCRTSHDSIILPMVFQLR